MELSKLGSLLSPFGKRVPYYIGALKRDPKLGNYPHGLYDFTASQWSFDSRYRFSS